MEWGNLPGQKEEHGKIEQMIDFLMERRFVPEGNGNALVKSNWKIWPWDIIWRKQN